MFIQVSAHNHKYSKNKFYYIVTANSYINSSIINKTFNSKVDQLKWKTQRE